MDAASSWGPRGAPADASCCLKVHRFDDLFDGVGLRLFFAFGPSVSNTN